MPFKNSRPAVSSHSSSPSRVQLPILVQIRLPRVRLRVQDPSAAPLSPDLVQNLSPPVSPDLVQNPSPPVSPDLVR